MKKLLSLLFSVLLLISPLSGCKAKAPLQKEELYALDTLITLSVYSHNSEALKLAKAEIKRLEKLLSVTDKDSDVYKINLNCGTFVSVSDECFTLIKTAKEVSKAASGYFDITVYPAIKLWGFTTSEYQVPDENELLAVKEKIGYYNIELNESNKTVKIPQGSSIDLGAIAKGYIADKTAEMLINNGVTSALLNFGGNIKLIGSKPEGEDFKIGIKAPFTDSYFATLNVRDLTVSTSGDYERYFEKEGVMYHHILNPFTASPAESDIKSATVIGKKGELCDALSTAAFVLKSENITELSESYPDYSFVLLTDERVYVSENIADDFTLADDFRSFEITII